MDAVLHRIEALPGDGRYAVGLMFADGTEQSAVVTVDDADVQVAEASLPSGWTPTSAAFGAVATAVRAMHDARRFRPARLGSLRDVPGGWDVALGNVVSTDAGPWCTAHGEMSGRDGVFGCADCGARAWVG